MGSVALVAWADRGVHLVAADILLRFAAVAVVDVWVLLVEILW